MDESLPLPITTKKSSGVSMASMARSIGLCVLFLLAYPAGSMAMRWMSPTAHTNQAPLRYQIDLATADVGELLLIPGIGETLANRWIEERNTLLSKHSDPLKAIGQMRGIGPQKLKVIQQYAIAKPPSSEVKPESTTP